MANKRRHFVLPHSSVVGKKPSVYNAATAPAGVMKSELAINISDGNEFLSTQNASGNIVTWWPVLEKGSKDNSLVKDSVVASNGTLDIHNVGEVAFGYNNLSSQEDVSDETTWNDNSGTTLFSIGNGADSDNQSNAFEVRRDGTTFIGGKLNVAVDGNVVDVMKTISDDEKVTSAALNDLNTRKADKSEIPVVSDYFDGADYVSSSNTINFYHGDTLKASIDATSFIKDGMVNAVSVENVESGSSTVKCLVITFNTDSGKENINIPISDIFDSRLYYTKEETNEELGALAQRCFQQCLYDEEGDVIYFANGELPESLVIGQINTSAFTKVSDVTINGTSIVSNKTAVIPIASSSVYGVVTVDDELDNASKNPVANEAVSKMIEKTEKVTSFALNDLNARINEHSENSSVHVTNSEKESWNEKQDALEYYTENKTDGTPKIDNGSCSIILDRLDGGTIYINATHTEISDGANYFVVGGDVSVHTENEGKFTYNGVEVLTRGDIDESLDSASQNPISNAAVTAMLEKEEEVTSYALNDLNSRVADIHEQLSNKETENMTLDGYIKVNDSDESGITSSDTINHAFSKVEKKIADNELVIASALNNVSDKVEEAGKVKLLSSVDEIETDLQEGQLGYYSPDHTMYLKINGMVIKFQGTPEA